MTTFVVNNKRVCLGGNVFMDSSDPGYQTTVSDFFGKYNINMFRTYETTLNGDTVLNNYMYPFALENDAREFVKATFQDPYSAFYKEVGDKVGQWYRDNGGSEKYYTARQILAITNDSIPVTESLATGDYTVLFEVTLA